MNADKAKRARPPGWDEKRWVAARREIRAVIWRWGLMNEFHSYKELTDTAAAGITYRSPLLTPMLNEIDKYEWLRQKPTEKCWVTAFVVQSGKKCSSDGLFRLVPKSEWESMGKTAFCVEQRRLAHIWIGKHPRA